MLDLQIIILAAGKGTRMGTDKPKVLVEMNGEPLVTHLLDELKNIDLKYNLVLVVGHQADRVKEVLGDKYDYALQTDQLGTAHATAQAKDLIQEKDPQATLVLYGDMPLVKSKTVEKIYNRHCSNNNKVTMATTNLKDFSDWREGFYSFGRIIRDESGEIKKIVEKRDADKSQLSIKEVNPSYFCFDPGWLWSNISNIEDDNSQDEYYLTDIIEVAVKNKIKIDSIDIEPIEALGANTPQELKRMETLKNSQ